jgi:hypothetical protein
MAGAIAAMEEAHSYLSNYHDFDEHELEYLLEFQNPLKVLADEWQERNIDLSDMSFAMEHIYQNSDTLLEKYPVIHDLIASVDNGLRRYMDVDLEQCLGKIADKVLIHNKNDWAIDVKTLKQAALSDSPEDKRLFWQVCGFGSQFGGERDTFLEDTPSHRFIAEFRHDEPDMFGFYLEIEGVNEKGVIKGNVYEVGDYAKFAAHIRNVAEPVESKTLFYSDAPGVNAGKVITVSQAEFTTNANRLMYESGRVKDMVNHPQDKVRLAGVISNERSKRMALPIGDPSELLQKVTDKLAEVRKTPEMPAQSAEKPKPKTLAAKMQAAGEKVKAQDEKPTNPKPHKRDERD